MLSNPYAQIYFQNRTTPSQNTTKQQTLVIVKHIGLIYNAFGAIMKDLIKITGYKYNENNRIKLEEQLNSNQQGQNNPNIQNNEDKKKYFPANFQSVKNIATKRQKQNKTSKKQMNNQIKKNQIFQQFQFSSINSIKSLKSDTIKQIKPKQTQCIFIKSSQNNSVFDKNMKMGRRSIILQNDSDIQSSQQKQINKNMFRKKQKKVDFSKRQIIGKDKKKKQTSFGTTCLQCQNIKDIFPGQDLQRVCDQHSRHRSSIPMSKDITSFSQVCNLN